VTGPRAALRDEKCVAGFQLKKAGLEEARLCQSLAKEADTITFQEG
jgi:hypothetical protein